VHSLSTNNGYELEKTFLEEFLSTSSAIFSHRRTHSEKFFTENEGTNDNFGVKNFSPCVLLCEKIAELVLKITKTEQQIHTIHENVKSLK